MTDAVLFKTGGGNCYFHSSGINRFLLAHPLMHYLLGLQKQGTDLNAWLESSRADLVEIDGCGSFSRQEAEYYVKKILLLLENGYMDTLDIPTAISGRLTAETVKIQLANTMQATFEVTEACNLKCQYCSYGKFYQKHGPRANRDLSFATAKKLLDYLTESWNSHLNTSHRRNINLSFYGGEPLLNFPLIKQIVDYSKKIKLLHNRFIYGMTTNGVLLGKHMDFLVENNFNLLISLDGNEKNNGFRLFADGTPSYKTILANVKELKNKHPRYFERSVNFNAVLHSKNSVSDVHRFFKEEFNKVPNISEVNVVGIAPEMQDEFWKTYKNFVESVSGAENYSVLERDMFDRLPGPGRALKMINNYSGYVYDKYNELFPKKMLERFIPTATCLPFGKKIFVTVSGKLLPCERIDRRYELGSVDENNVNLDFEQIARKYNNYYDKLSPLCNACYRTKTCADCMFHFDMDSEKPVCYSCMNYDGLARYFSENMLYLEENPGAYNRFMKEVRIV